jgi:hypothetical protein
VTVFSALPVSARPVLHVMLHGASTDDRYGWARPGEVETMLAGGPAPEPPPGSPDRFLTVPESDRLFWEAYAIRQGRTGQMLDDLRFTWDHLDRYGVLPPGQLADPRDGGQEMTLFLGAPMPHWLWSGQVDFPLCASHGRLARYRHLPRAVVPWICDSRGFSELSQHGRWTITPQEYVRAVIRYDEQIGGLQWAAPQDHMVEEGIIYGGKAGSVSCVGTRPHVDPAGRMSWAELVAEHQRLTVVNFVELTGLWVRLRAELGLPARPCPFIPVLQGDAPAAYLRHYQMYLDAGVLLGYDYQVAGVGSVCRLQRMGKVAAVARALGDLNLGLHWFGLKLTGLDRPEIYRDLTSPYVTAGSQSLDSEAWSYDARRRARTPGCTHVYGPRHRKAGQPSPCNNCPRGAALWRARVAESMAAGTTAGSRVVIQDGLFSAAELTGAP